MRGDLSAQIKPTINQSKMPKKPPRNAFYFYMQHFKEEERKRGNMYKNLAEVAEAAGPLWKNAPPAVRAQFEDMAKKEKQKNNIPEMKFTSHGISFAEIEAQAKELKNAEENERKDIKNMVKLKAFNDSIKFEDFYLMDVNYYCLAGSEYVIAEFTILRFNLADGIKDDYHEIINPGTIPIGYASDAKLACAELGLEMPDPDGRTNYVKVIANIMDYLRVQDAGGRTVLPAIYSMPDKVPPIQNFVQQLSIRASQDETVFRIYRLDTLFYHLINAIRTRDDEGFPKESLALAQLKKDSFRYNPGLACEHHETTGTDDKAVECTKSRVKRWAFTVLDHCCPVAGLDVRPGSHVPQDYHMSSILTYQEKRKQRAAPSVGGPRSPSCNSSMVSESLDSSSSAWGRSHNASSAAGDASTSQDSSRSSARTQVPRLPRTDFAKNFREAPDLSEVNFPSLSVGIGRGRGSPSSQNQNKFK
ncbi:hypothetical protein JYU34_013795 [Plutella xylostella]|uniref:HMG box domain-containing protein n=1 Tax=Plutella xylostella TaxID=51655 RepID=A0ABQ7QBZ3_PLUXY|nr:hypothetical protein JYU34_013795 [Plutella xylostella]